MISGDTRLQGGEHEDLAVRSNAPNGAAAVADIQIALVIESDSGGYAHPFSIGGHGAIGCYPIDRSVISRRNIELTLRIKSHSRGVHQIREKWLHVVVGINLVDR